jgi:hypothetical protein
MEGATPATADAAVECAVGPDREQRAAWERFFLRGEQSVFAATQGFRYI